MRLNILILILCLPGSVLAQTVITDPRTPYHRHQISKRTRISFPCCPAMDESMVGIVYGTQHQLVGMKLHDFTSWKFGVPFMLITDADWRILRDGESYFNLEFAKRDVARISQFDLGAAMGYKRIRADDSNIIEQF